MAKYKFKLSEMSKKGSPKQAEEEFDSPYETLKVGKVSFSDDGTSKSTITNIDPETGAVSWRIDQLPGFDKLYDEIDDLVDVAKRVYVKTKDDKKFREFYDEIRVIRNKIRTHLRNEYPDQYKRITRIGESKLNEMIDLVHVMEPDGSLYGTGQIVGVEKDKTIVRFDGETVKRFPSDRVVPVQEEEVDEISLSGAAGSYLTPYAFRKKGQKPNDIVYKELGYKVVKESIDGGSLFDYFNKKYIVDDHFHSDDSYIVKREPSGKDQYVIFDYDKDKDQFQIRQMGGYQIDQKEAKAANESEEVAQEEGYLESIDEVLAEGIVPMEEVTNGEVIQHMVDLFMSQYENQNLSEDELTERFIDFMAYLDEENSVSEENPLDKLGPEPELPSSLPESVKTQLTCPITYEIYREPVIDHEGNTYERVAILNHLKKNKTSPMTRNELEEKDLAPNRAVKDLIQALVQWCGN